LCVCVGQQFHEGFPRPGRVNDGGELSARTKSLSEPFSSTLGPKMVAVQNYHGNPAPPGKPVLTFQTGDVIELLRGDPDSPWWEVSPGSWRWGTALLLPLCTPHGQSREVRGDAIE
jgi:hypothetical protein